MRMSAVASGRFRSPENIGVKSKLATRLMMNGNATSHGNFPRNCLNEHEAEADEDDG